MPRQLPPGATRDLAPHVRNVLVKEFPVTSPARSIVDLCAVASDGEIEGAVDSACRLGLISPAYLATFSKRLRNGRTGIARIDAVILDAGGHSWLEREFLKLMRACRLPRPRTQVVHRSSTTHARVDFEFTEQRVIVEVSGRRGHSSDADRHRDAERRNLLQQQGFVVLEFLTNDVIRRGEATAATIASTLKRRTPGEVVTV